MLTPVPVQAFDSRACLNLHHSDIQGAAQKSLRVFLRPSRKKETFLSLSGSLDRTPTDTTAERHDTRDNGCHMMQGLFFWSMASPGRHQAQSDAALQVGHRACRRAELVACQSGLAWEQKRNFLKQKGDITKLKKEDITKLKKEDITKLRKEDITKLRKEDITKLRKEDITKLRKEDITKLRKEDITKLRKEDITKLRKEDITKLRKEDITKLRKRKILQN